MVWNTPGKYLSFALGVSKPIREPLCTMLISINYQVFKIEPFLLAAVVFYGAFFWFGSKINRTKANTWSVSHFVHLFCFSDARLSTPDNIGVGCARWLVHVSRAKKN